MITSYLIGGLGNQLFQIFTTISYAIKHRQQFKFLKTEYLGGCTLRYTYWDTFLNSLNIFLINNFDNEMLVFQEKCFNYEEISPYFTEQANLQSKTLMLHGYFQSYKYFQEYYKQICSLINLEKQKQNLLIKLERNKLEFKNTISMHFRIGDYKNLQNYHCLTPYIYYENSLLKLQEILNISTQSLIEKQDIKLSVIYFYELTDYDDVIKIINALMIRFPNIEFIPVHSFNVKLLDYEEMLFMSLLNHNIIANSSFSWWGAYFNDWSNKIVCYPSKWFGPALAHHNLNDLHPPEWIKINII